MPIDFPANPTNGMVFGNYIWDASITAWRNVNTDTGIGTLNAMGLKNVVPTSVQVGSGSATTNANGTVTFTGASSISLNGCFTSTYANYRIMLNVSSVSAASASGLMRLRAAGTNNSNSNYNYTGALGNNSGSFVGITTLATTIFFLANLSTGQQSVNTMDIYNPQVNAWTNYTSNLWGHTGGAIQSGVINGQHNAAYQADGFMVYPDSGTFGGTIQVFGYTN